MIGHLAHFSTTLWVMISYQAFIFWIGFCLVTIFRFWHLACIWGFRGGRKLINIDHVWCVSALFFFCHSFLKSLLLLRNLPIHDPIRLRGCNCVSPSSFFSLSDVPHFLVCGTDMKIGKGSVLNHFIYLLK